MGYIKKLKNNELVGGTDKHTIYPVTSTKAVFEEVTEGDKSSFKSQETINKEQQDTLDAHNGRVTYLEDHAVKSVTINGGTKTYTVDDAGNVNLDVYTTESAEGQATLAEEVGDIRSIVGTKDSPASDTLVNRVGELETLVGGSGQGSVNTRIANAKAEILGDAAEDYNTLGKVEDKIQEEVARATAEETELSIYVHAIEGGNILVKTSTPTNPDTGAPANTVYRVAGTTTYSDYMWNGTTMVKMAEYNVDTLESQFGYYKWETASNTISITTSNQVAGSPIGSYVLTSGGSFKIKMTNKATGACTLNMNGTGVKTLLYNGDSTDSSNTWEVGEVISVYYDGSVYQASNAQGGSNKKIDAYLYGDLRTLALGQTYEKGEAIKTTDKQLLRITKDIKDITLKEEIAIGDLKAYNNNTYKALKAVAYYDGTDTEGLYAIGKFSIVTITIDASSLSIEEDTDITVTIGSDTETITVPSEASETKAADIAALIATAFTSIDGWTLTDNLDGTLTLKCNSIGANTIVVSSNVGETGLQITSTAENGDNKLRQYNNGSWEDVSIADWVADTEMWELLNLSGVSVFTEQNTSIKTGTAENVSYDALQAILTGEDVQDAINEIGENLFETNSIALQLEASTKYYYTYSNGEIGTVQHNSFRKWLPVDISEYYAISSKFYLDSFHGAKTFFTDENDIKVGDFLINPDYKEHTYIVPKNAKKLYWSILYSSHTDISLKGIKRSSLKEKVAELEEGYKDEIDNSIVKKVSIYNPYGTTFYGHINMNGGVVTGGASSPYRYTSFIGVEKGDIICVHSNITQSPIAAIAAYDSNKQFVKGSAILADTSGNQDIIYRVPAGISYIRLSADITNDRWKAEKGISVKDVLSDGLHGVIEFTPDHSEGHFFIDLEGDFIRDNTNKWNVTVPFNVLEGDEVFFYTTSLHTSARLGAYSNGTLHKASEVVVGHSDIQSPSWYKYTVPQNVKWVRLSHMYSKDGDIKVYIRRKLEKMPKKSVSVLFIGNSITQDAVSYVPLLLRELAPELDFHFYVWYNGGYNLDQQLNSFNNDIPCEIFSRCSNGPSWKNFNNSVTMSSILSTYKFDIVQIQEYCHYKNTTELVNASVQTFNDIIEYIENHYNNPFKVATLYHKPLLDHDNQATAIQVFERTRAIVSKYLKETVTELLNPAGIAMYRAMATELDELGDQGHLSPDGRHGQEGLPCMIEAYVTAMWILNMLGIPMSAVNSKTVVDNTNYNEIYVPGPNLGNGVVIGTEDQVRLAQLVAVKALKEGEYIRNKELTEYTT